MTEPIRKSLRHLKVKRQKMRESFEEDVVKANELLEEEIEDEVLAQQAKKIQIIILRLQRNLTKYINITDGIAVQNDSTVKTDQETADIQSEELKDDECVEAVESSLDLCDLWLKERVPPKSKAAVAEIVSPQRATSE